VEVRFLDDLIPVQNQIEIERPRRARMRPRTAVLTLDIEEAGEEVTSRQRGAARCGGVQELGLITHANRISNVECRDTQAPDRGRQIRQRDAKIAFSIAQIAP